jgi:hypothetical protein
MDIQEFHRLSAMGDEERTAAFRERAREEIDGWKGLRGVITGDSQRSSLERAADAVDRADATIEAYLVAVSEAEFLSAYIVDVLSGSWTQYVQDAVAGATRVRVVTGLRKAQAERNRLEEQAIRLWDSLGSRG